MSIQRRHRHAQRDGHVLGRHLRSEQPLGGFDLGAGYRAAVYFKYDRILYLVMVLC
jgi:hypothetical protein